MGIYTIGNLRHKFIRHVMNIAEESRLVYNFVERADCIQALTAYKY